MSRQNSRSEMESENGSAVGVDPFRKIPKAVLTTHLLPMLMVNDVEGLKSLMVASPHFRKVALGKLTKKDWVQKMFSSKALREHFRYDLSGEDEDELEVEEQQIEKACKVLPAEWKSVTDNYFNYVYSLVPNYSSFKFLEVGSTAPLFGTPKQAELWIFQRTRFGESDKNGEYDVKWETNQDLAIFLLNAVDRGEIGSNPFQTRALRIELKPEIDDFSGQIPRVQVWLRALKRFGTQIRYARINKTLSRYEEGSEATAEIGSLLEQMPGLQQLDVYSDDGEGYCWYFGRNDDDFDPLPDLPNLTCLNLYWRSDVEGPLPPFLKYSDQITTFAIRSVDELWKYLKPNSSPKLFPNLERLSVLVKSRDDIMKLEGLTSPLKEIEILCAKKVTLRHCLEGFQTFSGTLVAARIKEYGTGTLDMKESPKVNLPNLRVLSIEFVDGSNCGSLDGLLGLSSVLGYLKIKLGIFRRGDEHGSGEIINLWDHWNDIYDSNIWLLMPALNEVSLEELRRGHLIVRYYTREDYVKRQEAKEQNPSN